MIKLIVSIGLSVGLLSLAACSSNKKASGDDLTGRTWVLLGLAGKSVISGSAITAQFTPEGKVSGSAGCNRYMGSYKTSASNITFTSPMASTMMMCEAGIMEQESAYLNSLSQATTYMVEKDKLLLSAEGGSTLLTYQAQNQDLAGSSWMVLAYNNGKQAVTSVLIGTTLTAEFGEDRLLSGSSGCNSYSGSYTTIGNQVNIGQLVSTKKYCTDPAGIMEQETQYLIALQTSSSYNLEGDRLELRTPEGALAVEFSIKPYSGSDGKFS